MNLHRFWFRFKAVNDSNTPRPGCGVTASNYDDALAILNETVFAGKWACPEIEHVIENVDIFDVRPSLDVLLAEHGRRPWLARCLVIHEDLRDVDELQ